MECKFKRDGEYLYCQICNFRFKSNENPIKVHKICTRNDITEQVYPSLIQQAKNALSSGIDYIKSGFKNSDEEEKQRRMEICTGNIEKGIPQCPSYDKEQNRCVTCGCFLNWKTAIESSSCPLGKW